MGGGVELWRAVHLAAAAALMATIPAVAAIPGVSYAEDAVAAFQTITSEQLATMLEEKDFAFFNVHIQYEGEIAGTDALIPFDQIGENLDQLPSDRSAPIVLYCRSGRVSEIAANELAMRGYANVSHLSGMNAWVEAGGDPLHK